MLTVDQISQLKELINTAQTILIFFPSSPKEDVVKAALALRASLANIRGKEVSLLSPQLSKEQGSEEVEIKTELGNKNLQISFPYSEGTVDKVSYDIDEATNRFYLLIQPSKGVKPLDYKQIEYAYTGAEADLVFLLGISDYEKLEHLYEGYENMYESATVVSINTYEANIGDIKIDGSGKTGLSEVLVTFLEELALPLPADSATALLSGLESVTDNFASLTATADTFEMAARLMRAGARRTKRVNAQPSFAKASEGKSGFAQALSQKKSKDVLIKKPKIVSKTPKMGGLDHQPGLGGK